MKLSKYALNLINEYGDYYNSQIKHLQPTKKGGKGKLLAGGLLASGLGYATHKVLKNVPKQNNIEPIMV